MRGWVTKSSSKFLSMFARLVVVGVMSLKCWGNASRGNSVYLCVSSVSMNRLAALRIGVLRFLGGGLVGVVCLVGRVMGVAAFFAVGFGSWGCLLVGVGRLARISGGRVCSVVEVEMCVRSDVFVYSEGCLRQ